MSHLFRYLTPDVFFTYVQAPLLHFRAFFFFFFLNPLVNTTILKVAQNWQT